ncbi:MAG: TlpA family protein disulfide reductase [Armatimonadetes bacterium]|nr:TlpA family protein disulfide reductase [Armatimonadota bacterium]
MKISFKTVQLGLFGAALSCFSSAQAAPQIQTVTPQSLQSAIKAQKGKVVVVNFWATWCAPCVAELPVLAKLQRQYAKRGVSLILVSADEPTAKAQVAKTLAARGHNKSFLIKGDLVEFFDRFDPKDKGAVGLPRTYIYNRAGKQVKTTESDHTQAEFAAMLKPYL